MTPTASVYAGWCIIIEDDANKLTALTELVKEAIQQCHVEIARSYNSGLKLLLSAPQEKPCLVLLDVSLPTFEAAQRGGGGRMRPFAGVELLREIQRRGLRCRVIVVTQFEAFGEGDARKTMPQLRRELAHQYGDLVVGTIGYRPVGDAWKKELRDAFGRAIGRMTMDGGQK